MKAKDADEDDAARIVYSIYEPQTSEAKALFGINPNTGALFLQKSAISWGKMLIYNFNYYKC